MSEITPDRNLLPVPHPENSAPANLDPPGEASFSNRAKLWSPSNTKLEMLVATAARFALRLVDQTDGKAYTANEFEAKILAAIDLVLDGKADAADLTALSAAITAALALKADESNLLAHEGDTANPHLVTKEQVGLSNVNNTSDADKPVSTAQQAALDGKLGVYPTTTIRGINKTVHVSLRTDGLAGTGTWEDPFDGSSVAKLKAIVDATPAYTEIALGPGTFETIGMRENHLAETSDGLALKEGQTLRGCGIGVTTLKVVGPGDKAFVAIDSDMAADNITVEGLTIDLDWTTNFNATRKSRAVQLRGNHCTIRNCHAINVGGDLANGQEAFIFYIGRGGISDTTYTEHGLIEGCQCTNAIAGGSNTGPYVTVFMIHGSGIINRCFVDIAGGSTFGVGIGITPNECMVWIKNCHFKHVYNGVHGDTNALVHAIIRDNLFEDCENGVRLVYAGGGSGQIEYVDCSDNVFLLPNASTVPAGASARFQGGSDNSVGTVKFNNNLIMARDRATSLSGGGPYFTKCLHVETQGNRFGSNVAFTGTYAIQVDVKTAISRNNTYLDGSLVAGMLWVHAACVEVPDTGNPATNGLSFQRALGHPAIPNGSSKSATNMYTVKLGEGDFNLPSITSIGDYTAIVGSRRGVSRIRSSAGDALRYNGTRNKVDFLDVTLCGDGGRALLINPDGTNVAGEFRRVHFTTINSGSLWENGAIAFAASMSDCTANVTLRSASGNMIFSGTATGCEFPAGFFNDLNGATLRECRIGSTGTAVSGLEKIRGGTKFQRCLIRGTGTITCTGAGHFEHCTIELNKATSGNVVTIYEGSKVAHTIIRASGSATETLNTASASNCAIYHCSLSHALGANITNDVTTPYNVIDANI